MEKELEWIRMLRQDELFIKILGITYPQLLRKMRHFLGSIGSGMLRCHHSNLKMLVDELSEVVPYIGKMYCNRKELIEQISTNYVLDNEVDKYIGEIIDDIFRKLSERERYVFYVLSINGTDTRNIQMNSVIQNITEAWDYHGILRSYQDGKISDEEMSKYFFYNEALCCIQTVIIKNLTRYIYTIPENLACKDKLDHYRNVFMRKNAPQDALISNKYLIIDEGCSREASDSILSYIKDNVIVSFNDVKLYHTKLHEDSRLSYKLFMDNLNKMCLDISYKSNTSSSIHEIPIGSYLKATYMVNNKQSIVYVYYNGEIPENVRVPKHIKLG